MLEEDREDNVWRRATEGGGFFVLLDEVHEDVGYIDGRGNTWYSSMHDEI